MAHHIGREQVTLKLLLGTKNRVAWLQQLPVMKDRIWRRRRINRSVTHLLLASNLLGI